MSIIEVQTNTFEVQLSDLNVEVGQTVTLTCKLNKDLPVFWYKEQHEIQPNPKVAITKSNKINVLTICNAQTKDSGVYSCSCDDDNSVCSVEVEETREIRKTHLENEFKTFTKERLVACLAEATIEIKENKEKIDELQNQIILFTEKNETANKEVHNLKVERKKYERQIASLNETVKYLHSKLDETSTLAKMQLEEINKLVDERKTQQMQKPQQRPQKENTPQTANNTDKKMAQVFVRANNTDKKMAQVFVRANNTDKKMAQDFVREVKTQDAYTQTAPDLLHHEK